MSAEDCGVVEKWKTTDILSTRKFFLLLVLIQPEYEVEQADAGLPNPSRETKSSGANGDRDIFIFPVQLTTSRIGNLTRLILTLAICDDHTYIYTYCITVQSSVASPHQA